MSVAATHNPFRFPFHGGRRIGHHGIRSVADVYSLFWRFTGTFSNPLILDYNNTDHPDSMSSDETYLEAFIETLSTLPHEVRRNMDLIKDLDKASGYVLY
jgi:hypothetical protein